LDNADRWARTEEIFHRAVELPESEVDAFLAEACAGDADLLEAVRVMLRSDQAAGDFMEDPAFKLGEALPRTKAEAPIGPYELVRPIGAGGMGEVYLARERGGDYERFVALKVIRPGTAPEFSQRFSREKAILAQLKHPGIARFLGGGTTEEGRPYYAMEYVEGERIDVYADRNRLTVRQRVELFQEVCLAVQHAHSNLVVHRDLKPDHVVITPDGSPKLLDFGIAKLMTGDAGDTTVAGSRMATPAYAAPEQLAGEPVSTASDVYSLGVILFELLSGHRPFSGPSPGSKANLVGSDSPPPPSTKVRKAASRTTEDGTEEELSPERLSSFRQTAPGSLRRALKGDLDTIVLKAIRPEPIRRYVSAAALAEDLGRYLAGEPVLARPASVSYRIGKLVRRHRMATAASVALALTVTASVVGLVAQNRKISTQAVQLTEERDRALEVQGFLLESFGSAGADDVAGDSVTVRQVLDARANQIDNLYPDDPATRAEVIHVLADGYERLGLLVEAQEWAERAVAERQGLAPGPFDPGLARSEGLLGWVHYRRNRLDDAEELIRRSVDTWRAIGTDPARLSRGLNDLSGVLMTQGDLEEAEELGREAIGIRRAIYPSNHPSIAITANNLGNILGSQGRHEEAQELLEESARILEATLGPLHRRTLFAKRNISIGLQWLGDWEGSARVSREVAEGFEELGGPMDVDLAWALLAYGPTLARLSRPDDADSVLTRGLQIAARRLGDHDLTASFLLQKAALYRSLQRPQEALQMVRDAVEIYDSLYDDHPRLARTLRNRGDLALDPDEKAASYQASAEMYARLEGDTGQTAVEVRLIWARYLLDAGRPAEALPVFQTLRGTVEEAFGSDQPHLPAPFLGEAQAYAALGDEENAAMALDSARARMTGAADISQNREWLTRIESTLGTGGS
jgi:serine/threonine-protein kinase